MTVDHAVQTVQTIISQTLEEYNQSPDSKTKDEQGNEVRIPHPLDIVDQDDILFALDLAIKDVALKTVPTTLLETNDSTADELRRVTKDYYVRVPQTPTTGHNLDIDNGLAYAVVFRALGHIWQNYAAYDQKADIIINNYDVAYRKYIDDITSGNAASSAEAYIRFSADATTWHDSYQSGDIYISFKRIDTDSWTPAIRFVGQDGQDGTPCSDTQFTALQDTPSSYAGMGGKVLAVKSSEDGVEFTDPPSGSGGASKFIDLDDTPASYTPDKYLKVNAAGNALEFTDAPSGGGAVTKFANNTFYNDDASGELELDCENYNSFYIYPNGDVTLKFKTFQDDGTDVIAWFGVTYTFAIVNGGDFNIAFDSANTYYGDTSVAGDANNYPMTLLRIYFDGVAWIVVDRVVVTDYQP